MKLLKSMLVLMIVAVLCFAMIGCAPKAEEQPSASEAAPETSEAAPETSEAAPEKTFRLGISLHLTKSEYGRLMYDGYEAACADLGVEYEIVDADNDVTNQIGQVETLITNQVDGILITPVDVDAAVPAIEKAKEAGIPVVAVNTIPNTDIIDSYVGSDDVEVGRNITDWMAEQLGEEGGKVVVLQGHLGMSSEVQRTQGIEEALANHPQIEVLAMETADWMRDMGMDLMENWLTSFGDEIDGVIAENDEMGIGAMQAVVAANLDKKIYIIGVDGLQDAKVAIQDGTYDCTYFQDAAGQTRGGVEAMLKILKGESVDKETWIPFVKIDASNVADFM
ncbi:MAG: substrate-binding domain-containing protein [Christensenellales bacterium]|jgi:inositol transport system substrate-binding protein